VIRGHGWAKSVMAPGIIALDDAGKLLGARCADSRCDEATTRRRHEPCRVTASPSRSMRDRPAARAVASRVGRSRR
jgi:hypothetical protein